MLESTVDSERLFSDRDFDDMMYPVHTIKGGTNLMETFQALKQLPSFVTFNDPLLNREKCIRYVIYCYDRQSPIFKKFRTDDVKRKTTAAMYAKWVFDEQTGLFADAVNDLLMGFNKYVNLMIIDYVKQYQDPEYSVLVSGRESLFQKLQIIGTAIQKPGAADGIKDKDFLANEKKKGELYTQAEEMAHSLKKLSEIILTDDNKLLKKDLYSVIDQNKKNELNISPEHRAGV